MNHWNYENEQWKKLPSHLKHLPLFTRAFDFTSFIFRVLWAFFLKTVFKLYIFLKVKGSIKDVYKEHPKLIVISNHASHIDAISIAAAVPMRYWLNLYIAAAKDYWFRNPLFVFFSSHCLGAVPIDRKDKKQEAIYLCIELLTKLKRIWLILFPEGGRSSDGYVQEFKKGVSLFSLKTGTPILFLYIEGNNKIMPKGSFPRPGRLTIHVGPVQEPADIETINKNYRKWTLKINPHAYKKGTFKD